MNTTKTIAWITWKTTKNSDGTYSGIVYAFGYQVPSEVLGTYTRRTRAQAVGAAKRAMWHFKSIQS